MSDLFVSAIVQLEEQKAWVQKRLTDIRVEEQRMEAARETLEKRFWALDEGSAKGERLCF